MLHAYHYAEGFRVLKLSSVDEAERKFDEAASHATSAP